jgi:hypothetical protein
MLKEHFVRLGVISSLLGIGGLVLMFFGVSFGTSLGTTWLVNQEDGVADTNQYMMVIENYTSTFLVSGSILFAVGLLTAILTYFTFLFRGITEMKVSTENNN